MPRSRRSAEEEEQQSATVDYEAETPWNQLRNTIDQLASVVPLDAVKEWYYVRHSTGLSYAYLLASLCFAGLFMAMLVVRWRDDHLIENTTFESGEFVSFFSDTKQASQGVNIPDDLAWYLVQADGTAVVRNSSLFTVSFEQCQLASSLAGASAASPSVELTCAALRDEDCTVPAHDSSLLSAGVTEALATCLGQPEPPEPPEGFLKGTPDSREREDDTDGTWRFVRARVRRCVDGGDVACGTTGEIGAVVNGASLSYRAASVADNAEEFGEEPVLRDNAAQYHVTGTFQLSPGVGDEQTVPAPVFEYEAVRVEDLPKVFVDGVEGNFASFVRVDGERFRRVASDDSALMLEATYQLGPARRVVNVQEVNLWDLLGQWWSFMLVLAALGIFVHAFNRWHFYKFGKFEFAGLPNKYTRDLLDPFVPITTPKLPPLLDLHSTRAGDAVGPEEIRAQHAALSALRRTLDETIKQQLG